MTPAQDAESYRWPALSPAAWLDPPAAWLEEPLTFCADGNLLSDRYSTRAKCGYLCLGRAA